MSSLDTLKSSSDRTISTDGLVPEEDDSALAFADYYFTGGKHAGYVMRSPSARKFWISVSGGESPKDHYKSFNEAEASLLAKL